MKLSVDRVRFLGLVLAVCAGACGDDSTGSGGAGSGGAAGASDAATTDAATTIASTSDATSTAATDAASSSTGAACATELTDDCALCMADACCMALADCEGDADCWACVTGEDVDACEVNETTHARVDAYLTCRGGDCNEACIGSSGDCEEAAPEFGAECGGCLAANCCEELGACYGSEGCWESCVVDFSEAGCHADADGARALPRAGRMRRRSCEEECL